MVKIYLDTNVYDELVVDEDLLEKLVEEVRQGRITFLSSHATVDEINNAPSKKRRYLLRILEVLDVEIRPTSVTVVGVSKLGKSRLGAGRQYNKIKGRGNRNIKDAITSDTAVYEQADFYVTNDRKLRKRIEGVEKGMVVSFEEFKKTMSD